MDFDFNNISEESLNALTDEQREKVREYQHIHARLRILKMQMNEIQEETHDLLETLNNMRIQDKNNN